MIRIDEITATNFTLDDKIKKYVTKKVGKLEKLLPKQARESTSARVVLSLTNGKNNLPTCEVILNVPDKQITAKEATINMFSSVDIVESKLAAQLRKYKDDHSVTRDRRTIRRFLGKAVYPQ